MLARVVSLQVGRAADLPWGDGTVRSGIVKTPVDGALPLGPEGFDGDEQADLTVHGGPDKAVCCYPREHVPLWEEQLGAEIPFGAFGENLSLEGLVEADVNVGDTGALGTAVVQVSQPRGPCFKLAARWRKRALPALMARGGISGWYLRVLEPGVVRAGDELALTERRSEVSIADVMRVTYTDRSDLPEIGRVLEVPELAQQWRWALEAIARRGGEPVREFGT
jgi:MOSC domain-containing protein YiiM